MDSRLRENDGKKGLRNLPPTFVTLVEKRGSILGFHRSLDSRLRENDAKKAFGTFPPPLSPSLKNGGPSLVFIIALKPIPLRWVGLHFLPRILQAHRPMERSPWALNSHINYFYASSFPVPTICLVCLSWAFGQSLHKPLQTMEI